MITFVDTGNVSFNQPEKNPPQRLIPGDERGISVPPEPTNRIHAPPLVVLNSGPLSQVLVEPTRLIFRVGSLIVV